jgi:Ala-tRNA(Pro) deacylase
MGSEKNMPRRHSHAEKALGEMTYPMLGMFPLWDLDIEELTGHNLEVKGREEVNHLLQQGWRLLHIYTLKYQEDGVWRERPMAILGKERKAQQAGASQEKSIFRGAEFSPKEEVDMPLASLREYLDKHNVQYIVISHSPAYTAQSIAALAHIPGKELAKTVIVKLDGKLAMAVLPASFHVDLRLLKHATKADAVELAFESEFNDRFPECEPGAMPPFGNLYGMDVFAEESLAEDKEIAFNAGSHRELLRMSWEDFAMLVKPMLTRFAAHRRAEAA